MGDPLDFTDSIAAASRDRSREDSTARGNIQVTDGVIPMFFTKERMDSVASEAAGRPIFVSEDWIEIIIPGSRDRPVCPVRPDHRQLYPQQWESYKNGEARNVAGGTPISEWQAVARTRAAELKAQGFYTVEQLASASDTQRQKIGADARFLVDQASAFIAGRNELDSERRLRAEMETKYAEQVASMADMQRTLTDMQRKLEGDDYGADDQSGNAERVPRVRRRSAE